MKLTQFQKQLRRDGICAAFLYSLGMEPDPNFYYFTQYAGAGALVVPQSGKPTLLAPKMEYERAKQTSPLKVKKLDKKQLFASMLELTKGKNIGIDKRAMSLAAFDALKKTAKKRKFSDISTHCAGLRTTKTKTERDHLRKACRYGDKILQKAFSTFKDFKTEAEVAAFLRYETARQGLELSFPPIVASGRHGSMPHCEPKNTKLLSGLCVIDFGVKYKGYCSDITRTVGIGTVPKAQKEKYEKLWMVQESTLRMIEDGTRCHDLYQHVVDGLGKDAPYFTHGLGHGIGVEVHELPNLKPNSPDHTRKHIPFTVEPGVYYPGKFGIRIEDSVMLDGKLELLTKTTKDLLAV